MELLLSSCLFSIGEVATADLGGLLPRGRARDGHGHPEALELEPSEGVGVHFGVAALVVEAGEDCLAETTIVEGEEDDDEKLKGAFEANFEEEEPFW